MRKTTAAQVALCGLLGALAVVIMLLGGIIPVATFCCPVLAAVLIIPVIRECGKRLAWVWYALVAILSCLLGPDKEAAAIYLFLGYYPIVKIRIDEWKQPLRFLSKLVIFNAAIAVMYALLIFVIKMDALRQELFGMEKLLLIATLVLGNVTFFLFDKLLPRMAMLYELRFRGKLWKH